jgi:hypothetical protein
MTTTVKKTNGTEVKNEVINETSNINGFVAEFLQVNKAGVTNFQYKTNGTISDLSDIQSIASHLAFVINEIFEKQSRVQNTTKKQRVFHLSKGSNLYFKFRVNGELVHDTQLFSSLKVLFSKFDSKESLQIIIQSIIEVLQLTQNNTI